MSEIGIGRAIALLPEEGAKFYARIDGLPGEGYRASCFARVDCGSHIDEELPEYHSSVSEDAARAWVHRRAAQRGFSNIRWLKTEGEA